MYLKKMENLSDQAKVKLYVLPKTTLDTSLQNDNLETDNSKLLKATDGALILYTSGTTGNPKGTNIYLHSEKIKNLLLLTKRVRLRQFCIIYNFGYFRCCFNSQELTNSDKYFIKCLELDLRRRYSSYFTTSSCPWYH